MNARDTEENKLMYMDDRAGIEMDGTKNYKERKLGRVMIAYILNIEKKLLIMGTFFTFSFSPLFKPSVINLFLSNFFLPSSTSHSRFTFNSFPDPTNTSTA